MNIENQKSKEKPDLVGQAGQGGRAGEKRGILVSSFDSYAFEKITLNDITAKQAGRPFK